MRYAALATDYDGTLAWAGTVAPATLDALVRARAASVRLVLVTGRELQDLFNTFPSSRLFDRIVAENGAVMCDPSSGAVQLLTEPAAPALVQRLTSEKIPFSVGHSIVATVEPYAPQMAAAISELRLPWHIIPNKESFMALPIGVTKATGLRSALAALDVSLQATVGIGDAENDEAFLRECGLAVAVRNALPSIIDIADVVTRGNSGDGVIEVIDEVLLQTAGRGAQETAETPSHQN
jgi:hydroxymethylpyrimidine pyrophosphatase-like HAD family hydrolase